MAKRERNRDRERTRIREEWERENKARADRGEEPLPESEIDRQLDEEERLQSQELNHDDEHRRPEHRDAPPTPELTPGSGKGESHWNDPENVKNAIHYFEHERPQDREQQQAIADELEKEREEAAMQQEAERLEEGRSFNRDNAGDVIRQLRPDLAEQSQETEQDQSYNRDNAGDVIRRLRPDLAEKQEQPEQDQDYNRDNAGDVIRRQQAEREAKGHEIERDDRDDIEHDR